MRISEWSSDVCSSDLRWETGWQRGWLGSCRYSINEMSHGLTACRRKSLLGLYAQMAVLFKCPGARERILSASGKCGGGQAGLIAGWHGEIGRGSGRGRGGQYV